MKREIAETIFKLLNHIKLSIFCDVSRSGIIDFFTKHEFSFDIYFDEDTNFLELTVCVDKKKPNLEPILLSIEQ
jgi:hypothetical protein